MNWDQIEANWKQFTGKLQAEFGKLTDSDVDTIKGNRDQLIGKIQELYGIARDEAEKRVNQWSSKF